MQLTDVKFACLDTETTGLSPEGGGKICEVALSVSRGGRVLEEFSTLLNPGMPMHPDVIAIHGITNEMVASAPSFADVLPKLLSLLDDCVIVAHNADFDVKFMRTQAKPLDYYFRNRVIDTVQLAREVLPSLSNHKLNTVCDHLRLGLDHHHAGSDALACGEIFLRCLEQGASLAACRRTYDLEQCRTARRW